MIPCARIPGHRRLTTFQGWLVWVLNSYGQKKSAQTPGLSPCPAAESRHGHCCVLVHGWAGARHLHWPDPSPAAASEERAPGEAVCSCQTRKLMFPDIKEVAEIAVTSHPDLFRQPLFRYQVRGFFCGAPMNGRSRHPPHPPPGCNLSHVPLCLWHGGPDFVFMG